MFQYNWGKKSGMMGLISVTFGLIEVAQILLHSMSHHADHVPKTDRFRVEFLYLLGRYSNSVSHEGLELVFSEYISRVTENQK